MKYINYFVEKRRSFVAKIIELCKYRKSRLLIKEAKTSVKHPIWFYELNDGINNLASKNQDIIISNVKEQFLNSYYIKLNKINLTKNEYSVDSFLIDTLDLLTPFSIPHGVQFARNHYLDMISDHDWCNLTDIIIRICVNNTYKIMDLIQPFDFAKEYSWNSLLVDITNSQSDK